MPNLFIPKFTQFLFAISFVLMTSRSEGARMMENLSRGLVAFPVNSDPTSPIAVSWRMLPTEDVDVSYLIFRTDRSGEIVQITPDPIESSTHYIDHLSPEIDRTCLQYSIAPVADGEEVGAMSIPTSVWKHPYLDIPIQPVDGYRPGDASVGDLDGDGEYEIVLHQVSQPRDNSHPGVTGSPILDAYKFDGTHLWRIDLGKNIREGEHYTQFMVFDLDGDGRAEVACKTADGTVDGTGTVIGDSEKDWRIYREGHLTHGRILSGPEYFTIFDGLTGAALKTVDYVPNRDPIDGWGGIGGNGGSDSYGNRCDRFLACVAYLDGRLPSVIMCRGVYGRTVMAAWDWRDGELTQRWVFDSGISYPPFKDASPYSGMGGHSLSVADVDEDGRDEIIYQAMAIDDDGKGMYTTGRRHGDAMHLSDFYPERPGLEMFLITENEARTQAFGTPGAGVHDARTGEALWTHSPGIDVTSGLAADIDPRFPGYECWGGPGGLRDQNGADIGPRPRETNWAIWWEGDPLRELLSRTRIYKWDWEAGVEKLIFTAEGRLSNRGPNLMGDLIGDWREEMLITSPDGKALRLYTTPIPTQIRIPTLMSDPQYRLSIAWQNVVYNKPPHPGFFLGEPLTVRP